ncbi:unnamed protein product [Rotaria sp. Silwood1]|nr:unnamed protein product [Rotaria sp. Silwood1]
MLLETFCLIWLDASTNVKVNQDAEQKLQERSENERVIIIVNDELGRVIIPSIFKLRQVISIYIYDTDKERNKEWIEKFTKIKAVTVELDELIIRIQTDHKIQKILQEPLCIDFFTVDSNLSQSADNVNGQFLFFQLLIECLLQIKPTNVDTSELIKICQNEYEGNELELSNLCDFKRSYSSDKALWWYTRQSFFYKVLNAILFTENIHMIFLFRSFISDIQHELKKYQTHHPVRVYREQIISSDELNTLKKYLGQFISINSFFSTTTNYQQAVSFLDVFNNSENFEPILFEIYADPDIVVAKPFGDISEYLGESRILFMLGSIFHLNSIKRNENNQIWIIQMTLCSENEPDLKQILMHTKQKLSDRETNLRTLGKILWDTGKFDLAEKYLTEFLNQLPSNDPSLSSIYDDLSKVALQAGDYEKSVRWSKKAFEFRNSNALLHTLNINVSDDAICKFINIKDII